VLEVPLCRVGLRVLKRNSLLRVISRGNKGGGEGGSELSALEGLRENRSDKSTLSAPRSRKLDAASCESSKVCCEFELNCKSWRQALNYVEEQEGSHANYNFPAGLRTWECEFVAPPGGRNHKRSRKGFPSWCKRTEPRFLKGQKKKMFVRTPVRLL